MAVPAFGLVALTALTLGSSAAPARPRGAAVPRPVQYKVTLGITGGATRRGETNCITDSSGCTRGSEESDRVSVSVDDTFKVVGNWTRNRFAPVGGVGSLVKETVNGSLSSSGKVNEQPGTPYVCSGRVAEDRMGPSTIELTRHGNGFSFTLTVSPYALAVRSNSCKGNPNWNLWTDPIEGPPFYNMTAKFNVSLGALAGGHVRTVAVSGKRVSFSGCGDVCSGSGSWHGSVKFTRMRMR